METFCKLTQNQEPLSARKWYTILWMIFIFCSIIIVTSSISDWSVSKTVFFSCLSWPFLVSIRYSTLAFEPQVKRLAIAIPCEHIYLLFIKSQQCHYKVNVVTTLFICCAKVTEWFISMLCFKTSQECPMWAVWALRSVSLCITTSSLLCSSNELGRTTESPITPAMW